MPTKQTDVERLRAAATKIRSLAEPAATDGMKPYGNEPPLPVTDWAALYGSDYLGGTGGAHVALWSPPVALAVADWLDGEAALLGEMGPFTDLISAVIENASGVTGALSLGREAQGKVQMHAESTPAALRLADLVLAARSPVL